MRSDMLQPNGIIVPVATPLTADGGLDETAFRALLRAQRPLVDGIFVLGSSGEMSWLTEAVAAEVLRVAREETAGQLPLYVGVGDTSLPRTLARVSALTTGDAEFVVVTSPYYYPVGQPALVEYFTAIADRSPIPVVLYNIPQNTGLALSTETLRALAAHENIVGVKDSSGDMFGFLAMLEIAGPGFSVLQGREQLLAASFYSGADGIVSSLGNVAPALLRAAIEAVGRGDRDRALNLQREITALATLFDHGYWVSALKSALAALGFEVGDPVGPLAACTSEESAAIAAILVGAKAKWLLGTPVVDRTADTRG